MSDRTIYVSPDGMGNGASIDVPMGLSQALNDPYIGAGGTIILLGGDYIGDYVCNVSGTIEQPLTITPQVGAAVKIDGSLRINGDYVKWIGDFEITYSSWDKRETEISGSTPEDIETAKSIPFYGKGSEIDGAIIHDMPEAIGLWTPAINAKIKHCVIYNIGWEGPDRGHGHLIYTQNETGIQTIEDCIMFQSFSTGLKIYTQGGHAQGYLAQRNIIFNSGILSSHNDYQMNEWVQDPNPGDGYTFISEHTYHSDPTFDPIRIGLYNGVDGVTLQNCYYPEGLSIHPDCEVLENSGGTYVKPENGKHIFVNPISEIKTHVAVYNWDLDDNVIIDLSTVTGLNIGDTVSVRNVQDLFIDIVELVLDGDKQITVDMRAISHTVAAPILRDAPPSTFPEFGCFVIEKVV